MSARSPKDGFDVWVIDPANGTVEQVDLESTSPADRISTTQRTIVSEPARPADAETAQEPAAAPKKVRRKAATSATKTKHPAARKAASKPRATKKPREPKTAKLLAIKNAATKKRAAPRKTAQAKKKQALEATEKTSPAAKKPAPRRKKVPALAAEVMPAPTSAASAPEPGVLQTASAPARPLLAATATDLLNASRRREAASLMVVELVTDKPSPRADEEPPRHGTIDIRFVDLDE